MSLAEQCCTVSRKPLRILQLSSPSGTPAPRSTECTTILLTLEVSAKSGVDQGCPLSACGFSAVVDPVLRFVMAQLCTHCDTGAKLFAYLDDWYLWIKPHCLLQTIAVITAATRSVNLALQSTKTQVWKGSCQDPIPPEFQDKVTLTLSCLGGHLQIHGGTEPSPVVLGEQATMEKTIQRFQKIATTLADLNTEGLNVQTVNDLLTMYVGAASQHVLRMSFVPEQEAQNFDRQVITLWSRLMHRDIASPLFFLPLKLGGLGVGSAVQRHAAAPWRAWQSIIPTLMATTHSPDTDSLFSSTPQLCAQLAQLQTTLSQQMNKPTFQLKPRLEQPSASKPLRRNKSPPSKETSTSNSTTASVLPTHPLNKPSSFHHLLHTLVRTSCSRAVKHMRLRIVASVSLLPED